MGHYVLGHIVSGIVFSFVLVLAVVFSWDFYLFQWMLRRFGASNGGCRRRITGPRWCCFVLVLQPDQPGQLSRSAIRLSAAAHEHAADVYGQEAGTRHRSRIRKRVAQDAFQLLGENGLSDAPYPSPVAGVLDLLASIRSGGARRSHKHYDPWAAGARAPKYFSK